MDHLRLCSLNDVAGENFLWKKEHKKLIINITRLIKFRRILTSEHIGLIIEKKKDLTKEDAFSPLPFC